MEITEEQRAIFDRALEKMMENPRYCPTDEEREVFSHIAQSLEAEPDPTTH